MEASLGIRAPKAARSRRVSKRRSAELTDFLRQNFTQRQRDLTATFNLPRRLAALDRFIANDKRDLTRPGAVRDLLADAMTMVWHSASD